MKFKLIQRYEAHYVRVLLAHSTINSHAGQAIHTQQLQLSMQAQKSSILASYTQSLTS